MTRDKVLQTLRESSMRFDSESGGIMLIVAIVAPVIIFVLGGIGFDMVRIKRATTALATYTDTICGNTSQISYLQREAAAAKFREAINDPANRDALRGAVLVSAHLTIPTMPEDGCFGYDLLSDCPASDPTVNGLQRFGDLLGPNNTCQLNCAGLASCEEDCFFDGRINTTAYLASLWSPLQSAGNTAGCELAAVVNPWLLPEQIVRGKSMWSIPVARHPSVRTDPGNPYGTSPGLTLAIAPQMTTRATDQRFRFNGGSLAAMDPFQAGGVDAYTIDQSQQPDYPSGMSPAPGTLPSELRLLPYTAAEIAPDAAARDELLAACMNPALAVRNSILTGILERAARHGELRAGTEILKVAPQHRVQINFPGNPTDPFDPGFGSNAPALILPFGDDLLKREENIQLPYVFYHSGSSLPADPWNRVGDDFAPGQGNWINPFVAPAALPDPVTQPDLYKTKMHHAIVASQLRWCYQLYHGNPRGITRPPVLLGDNTSFEPGGAGERYEYRSSLRGTDMAGSPATFWDQQCRHQNDSRPGTNAAICNPAMPGRQLNAVEVVSILGSEQKCPINQIGLPTGDCLKPADVNPSGANGFVPTKDLRPDLLATLRYLARRSGAPIPPGMFPVNPPPARPDPFKAAKSPGLFPLRPDPSAEDPWQPFHVDADAYRAAVNDTTTVLLYTHQRLSRSSTANINEVETIRCMVSPETVNPAPPAVSYCNPGAASLFPRRKFVVIYQPTEDMAFDATGSAALRRAIADFREAFDVSVATGNALFVLSPLLDEKSPIAIEPLDQKYRSYWEDLLTDPNNNVDAIAKNIFEQIILDHRLKF